MIMYFTDLASAFYMCAFKCFKPLTLGSASERVLIGPSV